jgi:hypothetical protein
MLPQVLLTKETTLSLCKYNGNLISLPVRHWDPPPDKVFCYYMCLICSGQRGQETGRRRQISAATLLSLSDSWMCTTSSICLGPFGAERRNSWRQLLTKLIRRADITLLLLQVNLRVKLRVLTLWTAMERQVIRPRSPSLKAGDLTLCCCSSLVKTFKFIKNLLPFSVVDKLRPPPRFIDNLIVNDQRKVNTKEKLFLSKPWRHMRKLRYSSTHS